MTKTSLQEFHSFLQGHQQFFKDNTRWGDYGGTDDIGKNIVKDMLAGGGMHDYNMLDFDNGVDLRKPIKGKKFDMGISMDLLEHVSNPFVVAKNIKNSLNKGAYLFVTAPFVWELHDYPHDYWRFSPDGLKELFDGMQVEIIYMVNDSYRPAKNEKFVSVPAIKFPWIRIVGIFKKI